MNNARRTYLLTLNSPSQRALRLWTGKSIHALHHCSVKEIGGALVEMQKSLEDLQRSMRALRHVKERLVSASADQMGQHPTKEDANADRRSRGSVVKEMKKLALVRNNPRGPFFRNISQKGVPRGGKGRGRSGT